LILLLIADIEIVRHRVSGRLIFLNRPPPTVWPTGLRLFGVAFR
jgi:hypothetical protein